MYTNIYSIMYYCRCVKFLSEVHKPRVKVKTSYFKKTKNKKEQNIAIDRDLCYVFEACYSFGITLTADS